MATLESDHGFSGLGPDPHPWYLSLEHALEIERERVAVITHVLPEGTPKPDNALPILVRTTFAQTYIWPVFRHLTHLGL